MVHAGVHLASRDERFARGPAHTEITEQLVCHRDSRPMPRKPEDIPGTDIVVTAGSSYVETLNTLNEQHPGIEFEEDADRTTEVILSDVAEQEVGCTVADSNIVQVMRRHFPHLEVAMTLTDGRNLGWYLPKNQQALGDDAHEWMNSVDGDEAIGLMENRYYSYIGDFDFVDLRALNRRIEDRLPEFIDQFREAEAKTGMPADLLAALADRHRRLPETIPEPDRTFLALASYNIGRGHLLDARALARTLNKNPDSWQDMTEVLPLKADKRYYPSTRYGYARGYEPVHYVQRIRNYRDVIRSAFE